MMGQTLVLRQRRMLRGWIKWIPVVLIPFSVLFTHAWLNIQILRSDYVLRALDKEVKTLQGELRRAGEVQSVQQDPEILAAQADRLAFITPKPGQREVIYYDPQEFTDLPEEQAFELARHETLRSTPVSLAPPEPSAAVAPQTESVPVPEAVVESSPALSVPETMEKPTSAVWIAVEKNDDGAFLVPVEAAVEMSVVLDFPPDEYVDEVPDEEAAMDDLEVL